jgi:hypothetical protein
MNFNTTEGDESNMTIESTLAKIEGLLEVIIKNTAPKAEATPPKPIKPAKEVKPVEPAKAAEPEKTEETDIFGDDPPAVEEKPLDKDGLRAVLVKYQTATTQENARKLLAKYGAQTLGAVKVEDYGKIATEAAKLTASKKAP